MAFTDQDGNVVEQTASGTVPFASILNGSSVAIGAVWDNVVCRANHVLAIAATGSVTAGVVALDGSLDGVTWFVLGSITVAQGTPLFVSGQPVRYLRASITTEVSGGTVTALVASA